MTSGNKDMKHLLCHKYLPKYYIQRNWFFSIFIYCLLFFKVQGIVQNYTIVKNFLYWAKFLANEIIPYLISYVITLFVESLCSGFVSVNSNKSRRKQSMAKGEKEKNMA